MANAVTGWLNGLKEKLQPNAKRSLVNITNLEGYPLSVEDLKGLVDLLPDDSEFAHQVTDAELAALLAKQTGC